jgi:hypothetical protein
LRWTSGGGSGSSRRPAAAGRPSVRVERGVTKGIWARCRLSPYESLAGWFMEPPDRRGCRSVPTRPAWGTAGTATVAGSWSPRFASASRPPLRCRACGAGSGGSPTATARGR